MHSYYKPGLFDDNNASRRRQIIITLLKKKKKKRNRSANYNYYYVNGGLDTDIFILCLTRIHYEIYILQHDNCKTDFLSISPSDRCGETILKTDST